MVPHENSGITTYAGANMLAVYAGVRLGNTATTYAEDPKNPVEVHERRQRLLDVLGVGRYTLMLTSGANGALVDVSGVPPENVREEYRAEVMFTDNPGIALALNAADCQQLVFYTASGLSILGLAHVSRDGAKQGVHMEALKYMMGTLRVSLADVRVFFGPAIEQQSYAFPDKDYYEQGLDQPDWQKYVIHRNGMHFVAVGERILDDFKKAHLNIQTQVHRTRIDTGSDPRYFSHSRSKREGTPEGRNGFMVRLIS